jgi:hypothetical protein
MRAAMSLSRLGGIAHGRDCFQGEVSDIVAKAVVYRLEVIDIDHQN